MITLLAGSIGMSYMSKQRNDALLDGAETINQAGVIRGSIQRVTKLAIAGCDERCKAISQSIDQSLGKFLDRFRTRDRDVIDQQVANKLTELRTNWIDLRERINEYSILPTPALRESILDVSEQCWEVADSSVLLAQLSTQTRISNERGLFNRGSSCGSSIPMCAGSLSTMRRTIR